MELLSFAQVPGKEASRGVAQHTGEPGGGGLLHSGGGGGPGPDRAALRLSP